MLFYQTPYFCINIHTRRHTLSYTLISIHSFSIQLTCIESRYYATFYIMCQCDWIISIYTWLKVAVYCYPLLFPNVFLFVFSLFVGYLRRMYNRQWDSPLHPHTLFLNWFTRSPTYLLYIALFASSSIFSSVLFHYHRFSIEYYYWKRSRWVLFVLFSSEQPRAIMMQIIYYRLHIRHYCASAHVAQYNTEIERERRTYGKGSVSYIEISMDATQQSNSK